MTNIMTKGCHRHQMSLARNLDVYSEMVLHNNTFAKNCIYRFGPNSPEMNRDKRGFFGEKAPKNPRKKTESPFIPVYLRLKI